jgi:hypothetical protein
LFLTMGCEPAGSGAEDSESHGQILIGHDRTTQAHSAALQEQASSHSHRQAGRFATRTERPNIRISS